MAKITSKLRNDVKQKNALRALFCGCAANEARLRRMKHSEAV